MRDGSRDPEPLTLGVVGAGRLGSAVLRAAAEQSVPVLLTATATDGWTVRERPDVLIDASAPAALDEVAAYCRTTGTPLVSCVSHTAPAALDTLAALAAQVPVLYAVNLAFGHYLQGRFIELARTLPRAAGAATAVGDRHPPRKAARPSATALRLADRWSAHGAPRPEVAFVRGGSEVSDHEITWTWPDGESVTVRHSVTSLAAPAGAALAGARWIRHRPPGRYSVDELYDERHAAAGDVPGPPTGRCATDAPRPAAGDLPGRWPADSPDSVGTTGART
ncbi:MULTISPECIES: dihydrodipicolinate reductase C-terminal domain-containing protein [unclassified Streptomyces]|uniref:dihydrodipicolinate reductase C-terminal domain-containing protein n=1 Tax=unclassified Streptomyces TaxID=2593676 RepID=UPI002E2CFD84|nr:dihydrodipicolinate reductase C-terminal domain-containing protein [Streptomyces sp. NBC_00223]